MSQSKINFNAGPAMLPPDVLLEVAEAVRSYKDTGISILELPHRGKAFLEIIEESKALVKELCNISDDYHVLWLQGGGRIQFAMIPMNLLSKDSAAGYIDSDHWSAEAQEYARYYGEVNVLASSRDTKYDRLPQLPDHIPANLRYVHYTTNNTIYGTQWHETPKVDSPLIADMSSDIFCKSVDYSKYAMFYAAAQKNLGTPGVALAVIHKDLLAQMADNLPPMLSYKAQVKENSVLNTANVSGVYISLLMLRWTKAKGLQAIEKENRAKAELLYKAIDASNLFVPHVQVVADRSWMNACFTAKDKATEQAFLQLCAENNIIGIEGHRSVGGFRVSLYNAVPYGHVERLTELMKEFETKV